MWCECSSLLPPHPPPLLLSFVPLLFALPYIVLAISQSTHGSYSSMGRGDPGPLGERGWKPSEYRKPFYLSLFILFSLMFSVPCSFSLSLPPLDVCVSGDCSESKMVQRSVPLPIAVYANRIIILAPACVASLTHLHLPLRTLSGLCREALAGSGDACSRWDEAVLAAFTGCFVPLVKMSSTLLKFVYMSTYSLIIPYPAYSINITGSVKSPFSFGSCFRRPMLPVEL